MSRHLLGYLVTRALRAVPLPPLAQPPAQVPRRGCLVRGASSGHLSLLEACWSEQRELEWAEGQHIAMASRSDVSCLGVSQEASSLALGVDRHPAWHASGPYPPVRLVRPLEEASAQGLRW